MIYNKIYLFSSMILSKRPKDDDSKDGFNKWPFMTTHDWAENPRGKITLSIIKLVLGKNHHNHHTIEFLSKYSIIICIYIIIHTEYIFERCIRFNYL